MWFLRAGTATLHVEIEKTRDLVRSGILFHTKIADLRIFRAKLAHETNDFSKSLFIQKFFFTKNTQF